MVANREQVNIILYMMGAVYFFGMWSKQERECDPNGFIEAVSQLFIFLHHADPPIAIYADLLNIIKAIFIDLLPHAFFKLFHAHRTSDHVFADRFTFFK